MADLWLVDRSIVALAIDKSGALLSSSITPTLIWKEAAFS